MLAFRRGEESPNLLLCLVDNWHRNKETAKERPEVNKEAVDPFDN